MSRIAKGLLILLVLLVALSLSCAPKAAKAPERFVTLATGSTGGTWFIIGAKMADVWSRNIPGVVATSEVTAATTENVRLLGAKKVTMAMMTTILVDDAWKGVPPYERRYTDFRVLTFGQRSYYHFIVRADSDIKSFEDLRGKRLAIGEPGGGLDTALYILEAGYDIKIDRDFEPVYIGYMEGVSATIEGKADASVSAGGVPLTAAMDFTQRADARVLSMSEEAVQRLIAEYPFFERNVIRGGTYKGNPNDVITAGSPGGLFTHKDVDEQLIYDLLKVHFEHQDAIGAVHPAGYEWSSKERATTLRLEMPHHPGAIRYLKEEGLLP